MAAILRDSTVVAVAAVVRTRPRAIPLAMITIRKFIHEFPLVSYMVIGLRLAARRSSAEKTYTYSMLGSPPGRRVALLLYSLILFYLQQKENKEKLDSQIESYFKMAASNQLVRERYGAAVLDIPGHETVLRPKETLQRLCDHLGVTCTEDYFEKCSNILFGTPSFTRNTVVWTEEQKQRVTEMMKKYPFMKEYSFDTYPS